MEVGTRTPRRPSRPSEVRVYRASAAVLGQLDGNRVQEHDRRPCLVGRELKVGVGGRPRRDDEVAEVVLVDPPAGGILCNHAGVSLAGDLVVADACTFDVEADNPCLGGGGQDDRVVNDLEVDQGRAQLLHPDGGHGDVSEPGAPDRHLRRDRRRVADHLALGRLAAGKGVDAEVDLPELAAGDGHLDVADVGDQHALGRGVEHGILDDHARLDRVRPQRPGRVVWSHQLRGEDPRLAG